jgi:hypothetical protein
MSEMLEKIERLASAGSITDPVLIEEITNKFLDIRYSEIAGLKSFESFVPWDISKGLRLNERSVSDCTIREILALIDMESFEDWYEIPKKDNDIFTGYFPNTACDCFMFVRLLCDKRKKNAYINRFFKIDYREFLKYLMDSFIKTSGKAVYEDSVRRRRAQVGSAYYQAVDLVFKAGRPDNDYHTPEKTDSGFTIGDVLDIANRQGTSMWMCGAKPLTDYAESVRKAYMTVNSLFMDCIKKNLINMSREQNRELLDKCRTSVKQSGLRIAKEYDSPADFDTKGE